MGFFRFGILCVVSVILTGCGVDILNAPQDVNNTETLDIIVQQSQSSLQSLTGYTYKLVSGESSLCSTGTDFSLMRTPSEHITDSVASFPDGAITVCVRGYFGTSVVLTSKSWTKDTTPPGALLVLSPGSHITYPTVTVKWTASSNQETYAFAFSNDVDCDDLVTQPVFSNGLSETIPAPPNGNYYFCLGAGDYAGNFTLAENVPLSVTVAVPSNAIERPASHLFPKLANQVQAAGPYSNYIGLVLEESKFYDLLVVDANTIDFSPEYMGPNGSFKTKNPNQILLTYTSAGDAYPISGWDDNTINGRIRKYLDTEAPSLFMRDTNGDPFRLFQLPNGPWTLMLDFLYTDPEKGSLKDWLPNHLNQNILIPNYADGVFLDWASEWIGWLTEPAPGRPEVIDTNRDGTVDTIAVANSNWVAGQGAMLQKMREYAGNTKIVMGNSGGGISGVYDASLNGLMTEGFQCTPGAITTDPYSPESWSTQMRRHLGHLAGAIAPRISFLMAISGQEPSPWTETNVNLPVDYQLARFTLASALMGDGYYTITNPGTYISAKWLDEFGVNYNGVSEKSFEAKGYLGSAMDVAVNAENPNELLSVTIQNGLAAEQKVWMRNFENGRVYVNPSVDYKHIELGSEFKFIKGAFEASGNSVNNGVKVSRVALPPRSGIVLLHPCHPLHTTCFQLEDEAPTISLISNIFDSGTHTATFASNDPDAGDTTVIECSGLPAGAIVNQETFTVSVPSSLVPSGGLSIQCWAKDSKNYPSAALTIVFQN